jgi:hypothetical protein
MIYCPTGTSALSQQQGVRSENLDKNIMNVYEHISRLSGLIVTIEDRLARWEKKMTKLKKKHEEKSEKRQAAALKMAAFDQTIDRAISWRLWNLYLQKLGLIQSAVLSLCPFSNRGSMQLIPNQASRIAIRICCRRLKQWQGKKSNWVWS